MIDKSPEKDQVKEEGQRPSCAVEAGLLLLFAGVIMAGFVALVSPVLSGIANSLFGMGLK